jgi:hypothetical protein
MSVIPENLGQPITHTVETLALKKIFSDGRSEELENLINEILGPKK